MSDARGFLLSGLGTPLLVVFGAALFPAAGLPAEAATVVVSAQRATSLLYINLRQSPDLRSPIVAQLRKGDAVEVIAESGEFVQVRTAAGTRGFVKRKYLVLADVAAGPATAPAPVPAADSGADAANNPAPPAIASVDTSPVAPAYSAPAVTADTEPGPGSRWYLRGALGWHAPHTSNRDLGGRLRSEGFPVFVDGLKDEAVQLGLNLGYRVLPHLSLEAGVLHLDDLDFTLTIDDPDHPRIPDLQARLDDIVPFSGTGLTAAVVAHAEFARWQFSARAGYFAALDSDIDITVDGQRLTLDARDDAAPLFGAGIEYAVTRRWHLGFDYQFLPLQDDVDLFGLTLAYRP